MIGPVSYGTTRQKRDSVTYAQIERAATDILKTGTRPTIEAVRAALGGGSPRTILDGLNRYWRDLGNQVAGTPDTLQRLPSAVADLAEGLWQRALSVAMDAAQATSTEVEGQLSRLKSQLELRQHTLSQREVQLDELLRSRERTVKELEEHLRVAMSMLTNRNVTVTTLESRLASAQQESEECRQRLAKLIERAVIKQRCGRAKPAANHKPSAPKRSHRPPRTARLTQSRPRRHKPQGRKRR